MYGFWKTIEGGQKKWGSWFAPFSWFDPRERKIGRGYYNGDAKKNADIYNRPLLTILLTAIAEGVGGIQYTRERKIDCGYYNGDAKKNTDIYNRPLLTTADCSGWRSRGYTIYTGTQNRLCGYYNGDAKKRRRYILTDLFGLLLWLKESGVYNIHGNAK